MDDTFIYNNDEDRRKGQRRKQLASEDITIEDELKKREMHREIEKKRRQEMGLLFASLRSLLPLEYIKGKRAMSDHISQAAKYVKDLENNVEEITAKRDELKKLSNLSVNNSTTDQTSSSTSNCSSSTNYVVVNPCLSGFEISIDGQDHLPLSRVLEVLLAEGIDIVSCCSSKVDGRLLHVIHTEVNDMAYVNLTELHQKLTQVINQLVAVINK